MDNSINPDTKRLCTHCWNWHPWWIKDMSSIISEGFRFPQKSVKILHNGEIIHQCNYGIPNKLNKVWDEFLENWKLY